MRSISVVIAGAALASCTYGQPAPNGMPDAAGARAAQAMLAGKVPGPPASCLPAMYGNNMTVIDGRTVAFHVGSGAGAGTVYLAHLSPGCEMVGQSHYTLVGRQYGGSLCSGDVEQLVDTASQTQVGACSVVDIIPYTR